MLYCRLVHRVTLRIGYTHMHFYQRVHYCRTATVCMAKVPVKVVSGGRVTIPSDVREDKEIEEGDYVLLEVNPINDS